MRRTFYPELESLRGLAAMNVVLAHCFEGFLRSDGPNLSSRDGLFDFVVSFFTPGAAAVPLFFVLSGFVLTQGTEKRSLSDTFSGYPAYALRRSFRILPAMWASALVAFLIYQHLLHQPISLAQLLDTLLMQDSNINGPLWSLPIEMAWSLALPFLFILSVRTNVIGQALLLIEAFRLIHDNAGIDLLRYGVCFQAGMLVGLWGVPMVKHLPRRGLLAILSVAVIVYCTAHNFSRLYFPERSDYFIMAVTPAAFVIVAYCANMKDSVVGALLRLPSLRFMGRVSYSLYVFHFLVLDIINTMIVLAKSQAWGEAHSSACHLIAALTVPALSFVTASMSFRFIETPMIALGKRLTANSWLRLPAVRAVPAE